MAGPYDHTRALILGAGVSGLAAARLLRSRGAQVWVIDQRPAAQLVSAQAQIEAMGAVLYAAATLPTGPFDVVVASPGLAAEHPWRVACCARGWRLISELALGWAYWRGRCLAVTGSKGKSSLVKLCADTLNAAGVRAAAGGNYGVPLSHLALQTPQIEWVVLEVSSFQMELTDDLRPDIAILLNIQADHLDRHGDLATYRALKLKLLRGVLPAGLVLWPASLAGAPAELKAAVQSFGVVPGADWFWGAGEIWHGAPGGRQRVVELAQTWFDNEILGAAAAAAVAALSWLGVAPAQIAQGLHDFEALPHRMQIVPSTWAGVRFINDSKATSLAAMAAALRMTAQPTRLIAGGVLKENDLDSVKEVLASTTRKVYIIGNSEEQMFKAWENTIPCEVCGTLERAVLAAVRDVQAGESVLLAPGAASFDQFKSYQERGACFMRLVHEATRR